MRGMSLRAFSRRHAAALYALASLAAGRVAGCCPPPRPEFVIDVRRVDVAGAAPLDPEEQQRMGVGLDGCKKLCGEDVPGCRMLGDGRGAMVLECFQGPMAEGSVTP
jgi:hypothetical protein